MACPVSILCTINLCGCIGIIITSVISVWSVRRHLIIIKVLLFLEHIDIVHEVFSVQRLDVFVVAYC